MALTREQQAADKALQEIEERWLRAYGWVEVARGDWMHRKVDHKGKPYSLRDAVALNRIDRTLGWPDGQHANGKPALSLEGVRWLPAPPVRPNGNNGGGK